MLYEPFKKKQMKSKTLKLKISFRLYKFTKNLLVSIQHWLQDPQKIWPSKFFPIMILKIVSTMQKKLI